jgi:secreted trypsin-like serine protease
MKNREQDARRRLIIGGYDIAKQRYPYYVSINKNNGVIVSGALIAPDIVLSAGHIALNHMDNLTVKIGPYCPRDENETFAETIRMERYVVHPQWNMTVGGLFTNDYMILKMAEKSSHMPVQMNRNASVPVDGSDVVITGVGWTMETILSPSPVVLEAEIMCISNEECASANDPLRGLSYAGEIDKTTLCTVSPPNTTRDGCAWDSGDPVIKKGEKPEDDLLVGLGSSGVGCADKVFPGETT